MSFKHGREREASKHGRHNILNKPFHHPPYDIKKKGKKNLCILQKLCAGYHATTREANCPLPSLQDYPLYPPSSLYHWHISSKKQKTNNKKTTHARLFASAESIIL